MITRAAKLLPALLALPILASGGKLASNNEPAPPKPAEQVSPAVPSSSTNTEAGTDVQPETSAVIRELYPEDQAVGFKLGDLRGMWRIQFHPDEHAAPSDRAP